MEAKQEDVSMPQNHVFEQFQKVYFIDEFCDLLSLRGIPYSKEWWMFMKLENEKYEFIASMGGRITVDGSDQILKKVISIQNTFSFL
jgi:hypothetical protein